MNSTHWLMTALIAGYAALPALGADGRIKLALKELERNHSVFRDARLIYTLEQQQIPEDFPSYLKQLTLHMVWHSGASSRYEQTGLFSWRTTNANVHDVRITHEGRHIQFHHWPHTGQQAAESKPGDFGSPTGTIARALERGDDPLLTWAYGVLDPNEGLHDRLRPWIDQMEVNEVADGADTLLELKWSENEGGGLKHHTCLLDPMRNYQQREFRRSCFVAGKGETPDQVHEHQVLTTRWLKAGAHIIPASFDITYTRTPTGADKDSIANGPTDSGGGIVTDHENPVKPLSGGTCKIDITQFEPNATVTEETFAFTFPPGTHVRDEFANVIYRVGPQGEQLDARPDRPASELDVFGRPRAEWWVERMLALGAIGVVVLVYCGVRVGGRFASRPQSLSPA